MMRFRYLSHTSEAKFQAYGESIEEAFGNVMLAMFNLLCDIKKVKPKIQVKIRIKSRKLESLLYDFVDELIFIQDTKGLILSKTKEMVIIQNGKGFELNSLLLGDNHKNYSTHGHIKAPTYNDMFIKIVKKQFVIQMVVDV